MSRKRFTAIAVIVIFILALTLIFSSCFLRVNKFPVTAPVEGEIKAVLISDLHMKSFGKENRRLIEKIDTLSPDIVFLNGDFVNGYDENIDVAINLTSALKEKYPVYFALGNHEKEYEQNFGTDITSAFENAGAVVLDRTFVDITLCGNDIRIGGLYDYAFATDNINSTDPENMDKETYDFLTRFQDTERYKIMLSHRPDSFIFGQAAATWEVDLVLSGHTHGGQVVIPFMGGLIGGDQGSFPRYVHGSYEKENIKMVITSGLSSGKSLLPRLNNPPEIAVVTISEDGE